MKQPDLTTITAVLFGAFALRVIQLSAQPLSGDEAFTVTQWGTATVTELLNHVAKIDPQPPVALLSYRAWIQLTGPSEFAVRLLSTHFSLITVASTYALSKRIFPGRASIFAAILAATASFQIWYAQDARPYAEWMALSLLATVSLLRALPTKRPGLWFIYIVFAALSLQTFYLEIFVFGATALFVIYHFYKTRHSNPAWLVSQSVIVTTLIPWLLYSKPQDSPYQPTAGFPDIPGALSELIFNNTLPTPLTTHILFSDSITILQLLILIVTIYAIYTVTRSEFPHTRHLLTLQLLAPILLLTALSLITHKAFFRTRYIATVSAPLLVLISSIPFMQSSHRRNQSALFGLILLIIPTSLAAFVEYRFNPQFAKAPPWRDIATILTHDALPNDIIIQNYPDPALTYYYQGPTRTVILPSTENPPPDTTIAQLDKLPASHDHIWFIRVDTPYWDKEQVVTQWLETNTAYLTDTWVGSMRLYQYTSWETTTAYIHNKLDLKMGLATLTGYRITTTPPYPAPVRNITIELFWLPQQHTYTDLRTFVHLITNAGDGSVKLWGQDDHPPQQGRLSTTSWSTAGTIFRDVYQIPITPETPFGTYLLTVGFYDPTTLARYHIPQTLQQPEPDAALITDLTIPIQK